MKLLDLGPDFGVSQSAVAGRKKGKMRNENVASNWIWRLATSLLCLLWALAGQCESEQQAAQAGSSNLINTNSHLRLFVNEAGRVQIPGLYDDVSGDITPVQGQAQFDRLVLGSNASLELSDHDVREAARGEQISLVQFYMASCPDCQGFSPYFKRFARDIAFNWRKLIKLYTVNCNDFQNIHLCQEQNPRLIVPMIRWYTFPTIQRDHIRARAASWAEGARYVSRFNYPEELLNIAHRKFIPRQRRDLTSLRRATLRFMALTLDELSHEPKRVMLRHLAESGSKLDAASNATTAKRLFYESLPAAWRNLFWLGSDQPLELEEEERFLRDLDDRLSACSREMLAASDRNSALESQARNWTLRNFVIFEGHRSFIGRTLIADWSSLSCTGQGPAGNRAILLHRSTDSDLLERTNLAREVSQLNKPILLAFNATSASGVNSLQELEFELVAWNDTSKLVRRERRAAQRPRLERVQQRALLEEYYSRWGNSKMVQPIRYGAAMGSIRATTSNQQRPQAGIERSLHKRDLATASEPHRHQAELDNVNWLPESVYASEERTRYHFNRRILSELAPWPAPAEFRFDWNLTSASSNWAEIPKRPANKTAAIEAKEDDLSLMFLTDYYRALDEIVHIDLLSKGELDGHQLLASCCFLRDLERHFPFQGNALGSQEIGSKSVARHYVQLVQRAWFERLVQRLDSKTVRLFNLSSNSAKDSCSRLAETAGVSDSLARLTVPTRELERVQLETKRAHDVGLPSANFLRWKYCAGSELHLRGHTCSLWVLFHTLTVHEYLLEQRAESRQTTTSGKFARQTEVNGTVEYEFQVDYSRGPRRQCDPTNPESAFLASKPGELFVNHTRFVLANAINFVRFYLPCTNCASHFSCMVEHSQGLRFDLGQVAPDSHLLWLWEAHNRVNERTRGTHSEDPARPKHIFPSHAACPHCYLEEPKAGANFTTMRFHRAELVKFVVARYRRSAILNNQINIEDLFRRQ